MQGNQILKLILNKYKKRLNYLTDYWVVKIQRSQIVIEEHHLQITTKAFTSHHNAVALRI